MLKKTHGNMYDWVTHMHSHLGGECPHKCKYCYVQNNKFGVSPRYRGDICLLRHELGIYYGKDKTIFIEHMNDLFANEVPRVWISSILNHCNQYPDNTYVFQTKNPKRAHYHISSFPPKFMIGTTIETNREISNISKAPSPLHRYCGIRKFAMGGYKTFVTIEPILDFDVDALASWIKNIQSDFVNIGADSKNCYLPEPSPKKVIQFIDLLAENNIIIKKKNNLGRFFMS